MEHIAISSGSTAVSCPNDRVTDKRITIEYPQSYPLTSICLMFFGFSMFGWIWEVGLHWVMNGALVNRGVLHGPWLPIYGVGSALMLVLLKRFQDRPPLCFAVGTVSCGIIEYFTSWALETFLHATWWDYSSEFMNLHGRICLFGLLLFGVAGCLVVYVAAPLINQKLMTLPQKSRIMICAIFGLIFIADLIFSMAAPNMGPGVSSVF